jgi:hypothetical protein
MKDLLRALCCVGRAVLVAGAVLYFVIDLLFLSLMMRAAFGASSRRTSAAGRASVSLEGRYRQMFEPSPGGAQPNVGFALPTLATRSSGSPRRR